MFCGCAGERNSAPVPGRARAGGGDRAGTAGAGRARAQAAAAVARWDCCRAAGPVSAVGPAGGRGKSGRAREGARQSARPGSGVPACRRPGPTRSLRPSSPSWSAPACEPADLAPAPPHTPSPKSPPPLSSPFLRAAATPPAPRHGRAIVSRPWARGDPPFLGARPFVSAASPAAFRPVSPLFPHTGGSPHPAAGGHPFTQICLFFRADGGLPLPKPACLLS